MEYGEVRHVQADSFVLVEDTYEKRARLSPRSAIRVRRRSVADSVNPNAKGKRLRDRPQTLAGLAGQRHERAGTGPEQDQSDEDESFDL
jgi:hypothetical protein